MATRALRLAVLRSNVGPLRSVYRALYAGGTRSAVALLRARFPSCLEAVYVRGSVAMGPLVPALSDVDLLVVLRDETSAAEHEAVKVFYRRLGRICPVFDPALWILRRSEVAALFSTNPGLRFQVLEGRQVLDLVYGADVLAELPEASEAQVTEALLCDVKSRLTSFNRFCLVPTREDALERRRKEYLLFKLTVDAARIELFLSSGTLLFRRPDVIARGTITDDPLLQGLVDHTLRFRSSRPFRGGSLEALEEKVLERYLELLRRFHDRDDVRANETVLSEQTHFYAADVFRPTGRRIERVSWEEIGGYRELARRTRRAHESDTNLVVVRDGLWINFGNTDPSIAHCTVVADRPLTIADSC